MQCLPNFFALWWSFCLTQSIFLSDILSSCQTKCLTQIVFHVRHYYSQLNTQIQINISSLCAISDREQFIEINQGIGRHILYCLPDEMNEWMNEWGLTTHKILLGSWKVMWHWQMIKLMSYGNECQWNEIRFAW